MSVLLAGCDEAFIQRLANTLSRSILNVDLVDSSDACLSYSEFGKYALIVLDNNLTQDGCLDVLKMLRHNKVSSPILIISDRREVADRVEGLDSGADDYLCKPFSLDEFSARARALLRRGDKVYEYPVLSFGDIFLDLSTNELFCNDHIVHLGIKEFQIMKMLINSGRQILPKDQLIEKVWGFNVSSEYNNVEVYISFLRKKMAKLGSQVSIKTLRSIGYHLC